MNSAKRKENSPITGDQQVDTNQPGDRLQESPSNEGHITSEENDESEWRDDEPSPSEVTDESEWADDEFRLEFEQSKTGDEDKTNSLLKRLKGMIQAACVKQLRGVYPREARLEELAQEVTIRIWQGLPDCGAKSEKQLSAWISQIAYHKHIDDVRPAKNKDCNFVHFQQLEESLFFESTNPYDEARFAEWLDQLSVREKVIVKLRWEEQLAYEEIGKRLPSKKAGKAVDGNSRSQIQREFYAALEKLELTCPLPKDTVEPRRKRREKYVKRKRKEKHGPEQ